MSAQTAADLRAAAAILRADGWTQGIYHCDGKHCAAGALAIATDQHRPLTNELLTQSGWGALDNHWVSYDISSPVGRRRLDAEAALEQQVGMPLPYWNDSPKRTASDVIDLFLTTADLEEGK